MFDSDVQPSREGGLFGAPPALDASALGRWVKTLGTMDDAATDPERIDRIRVLEELKSAAAAAQARTAVALDSSQRAEQAAHGVPADEQGKGIAAQIALARRDSPVRGGRHLGLAKALVGEMPHTLAALSAGRLSEWRATLLVRETACLSRQDRATVDRELVADPARLDGMGDRRLVAEAKRLAYRLDPESAIRRTRKAEADRRVTLRPTPDTMGNLTGLLPVAQAVAAFAALTREADALRSAGDPRTRGQIMADTLVQRVTGQAVAADVSAEIQLVMTDRSVFGQDDEPAYLHGHGPVPASWARDLLSDDSEGGAAAKAWVRRLYTDPATNELVAMDSRRRLFSGSLRRLLVIRDQICRTPWCDAPIRHGDHVVPHEDDGMTSAANGQGLCEQCNHAKQASGWSSRPVPGDRHTVEVTTPTRHTYRSTAPPLPGAAPVRTSRLDLSFNTAVLAA